VALRLNEMGYGKILVLKGGWNAWVEAGYPTESK
jgi:3-mercaptopyruvate sulfurtransferase SseA